MTPAGHAVSHDRREQGFDRAEQRNGERIRQQGPYSCEIEGGQSGGRKSLRHTAKPRSDSGDVELQQACKRSAHGNRD
jgi:hypothetical protein